MDTKYLNKKTIKKWSVLAIAFVGIPVLLYHVIGWLGLSSKNEEVQTYINAMVAYGTCAAVFVALLHDEILAIFKQVEFEIQIPSESIEEELSSNDKGDKRASEYYNMLEIANVGNINAQECELYLENAYFYVSEDSKDGDVYNGNPNAVQWGNNNTNVYIPREGRKVLRVFRMLYSSKQGNPDGKQEFSVSYSFLGFQDSMEAQKGIWELHYCLYSVNTKPKRFVVRVSWTGTWESREKEMRKHLNVKLQLQ